MHAKKGVSERAGWLCRSFYKIRPCLKKRFLRLSNMPPVLPYHKKPYRARKGRKGTLAKWKKLHKPETKYYDATDTLGFISAFPSAWYRRDLSCPIVQGTTASTRIGNDIVAKSIGLSFGIYRNASGASVQRVRWMLVNYKESEGSVPTAGELFQTTGLFLPQRNLQWAGQFQILADRTVTLDSAIRNHTTVRYRRKLGLRMIYQDTSGTTGGQTRNQLFLVLWSDQASNLPSAQDLSWRITFNDN